MLVLVLFLFTAGAVLAQKYEAEQELASYVSRKREYGLCPKASDVDYWFKEDEVLFIHLPYQANRTGFLMVWHNDSLIADKTIGSDSLSFFRDMTEGHYELLVLVGEKEFHYRSFIHRGRG